MWIYLPNQSPSSVSAQGGGLELGLELALPAARVVCWVEWEAFACARLVEAMEAGHFPAAPLWTDLRTFDGRPWHGAVDLLTAGYPCQPFSAAGRRRGKDDPRHLWPQVFRVIQEVRPPLVFLENVANHLRLGFEQVRRDLEGVGYRVTATLVSASEVGASHERQRLFILGVDDSARGDGRLYAGQRGPEPAQADLGGADVASARHHDAGKHGGGRPLPGPRPEQRRGELADTSGEGRQGSRSGVPPWGSEPTTFRGDRDPESLPLFPPGPGAIAEWRRILAADPSLAPALVAPFRELADGVAQNRRPWLRLLGNGVSPLQAAYAFCALTVSGALDE